MWKPASKLRMRSKQTCDLILWASPGFHSSDQRWTLFWDLRYPFCWACQFEVQLTWELYNALLMRAVLVYRCFSCFPSESKLAILVFMSWLMLLYSSIVTACCVITRETGGVQQIAWILGTSRSGRKASRTPTFWHWLLINGCRWQLLIWKTLLTPTNVWCRLCFVSQISFIGAADGESGKRKVDWLPSCIHLWQNSVHWVKFCCATVQMVKYESSAGPRLQRLKWKPHLWGCRYKVVTFKNVAQREVGALNCV